MTANLSQEAFAKINLTLRVLTSRPDGFHEIESLTARIGLSDTVTVTRTDDARLELSCSDPSIPTDDRNLAMRAALLLRGHCGESGGAIIELEKRVPAGAGLGGGSSDAAATLELLNRLWQTNLSRAELSRIGAEIGSDVPLFLHGPFCLLRGRGERVAEATRLPSGWAALILPPITVSTPAVYAAWDERHSHADEPAPLDMQALRDHADSLEALGPHLFNDLESPARRICGPLDDAFEQVIRLSDGPVRMTGSGSGLFRLFDRRGAAEQFAGEVRRATTFRVEVVSIPSK